MCQFTDHFYSAVRRLSGDGPVKQRLLSAYCENLELLPEKDIPESIHEKFESLRKAMHCSKPINGETSAVASVRKMSIAEAVRHTTAIVVMFSELVIAKTTGEKIGSSKSESQSDAAATSNGARLN